MTLPNLESLCSRVNPSKGAFFSYPKSLIGGLFSQDLAPYSSKDFFNLSLKDFEDQGPLRPMYCGIIPYAEPENFKDIESNSKIYRLKSYVIDHDLSDGLDVNLHQSKHNILIPNCSDENYLKTVASIIEEISEGDYYQLNLLRYFKVEMNKTWPQLINQWLAYGGPKSMLLNDTNLCVVSFSPETFFKISTKNENLSTIALRPIKGTISRDSSNPKDDQDLRLTLSKSEKDLAELNMIVDLMRHDLYPIARKGTISVVEAPQVISFPSIHHLQASVEAQISKSLTIGSILSSLCPAGSITGTPKKAVCNRILELEGRPRGYFMGHGIVVYSDGTVETSILIRTLISKDSQQTWDYAAGSGITIKSRPQMELNEILLKCNVIV